VREKGKNREGKSCWLRRNRRKKIVEVKVSAGNVLWFYLYGDRSGRIKAEDAEGKWKSLRRAGARSWTIKSSADARGRQRSGLRREKAIRIIRPKNLISTVGEDGKR